MVVSLSMEVALLQFVVVVVIIHGCMALILVAVIMEVVRILLLWF